MKKKIIGSVCLMFLIISACNKEENRASKLYSDQNESAEITNKSQLNEEFLIEAIDGEIKEYNDIFALEELLIKESPLSNEILFHMANSSKERVPDYLLELTCILSAKSSNSIFNEIGNIRSNLDIQFIRTNQRKNNEENSIVAFSAPRTLVFSKDEMSIVENDTEDCSSCSRSITASKNSRVVNMSIDNDVVEPIGGPAATCAGQRFCGIFLSLDDVTDPRLTGEVSFQINCLQSENVVCFTVNKH